MTTTKSSISESKSAKTIATKSMETNGIAADGQMANELSKLDQIRDMLFGEQVTVLRKQCQSLEKSIFALHEEMKSSVDDLKKKIDKNSDQLQKRINSEGVERTAQNEQLNTALASINTDIITQLDIETRRIDDALNEQHQESERRINSVADSLQDSKVDRKALAKFFSKFAEELGGSQAK